MGGKCAPVKSKIFEELRLLCKTCSNEAEHLAADRYLQQHNLIRVNTEQLSDSEDDDFTSFGLVSGNAEIFTAAISTLALFKDAESSELKKKSQFNDHLIKLIFETTRKPCCWSFGHIFTQSGEIKLHAVCLNELCDAKLIVYTENQQSVLQIRVYQYDGDVQYTKRRYVTGDDEKRKIEKLLEIESAMVTRAKLANEYIFEENEYAVI